MITFNRYKILVSFIGASVLIFGTMLLIANWLLNRNTSNEGLDAFFIAVSFISYSIKAILLLLLLACFAIYYYGKVKHNNEIKRQFIYCTAYTVVLIVTYLILENT